MEKRIRESFHLIWMIAVFLCAAAALFALIFTSCSKGSDTAEASASQPGQETLTAASQEPAQAVEPAETETELQDPAESPEPTAEPAETVLAETVDMGSSYVERCIFLGDSTTYGLAAYSAVPRAQVWCGSDASLPISEQSYISIEYYNNDGSVQEMSIGDAVQLRQPVFLIINVGLDSLTLVSEEEFKSEYADMIRRIHEISPSTNIICSSIFPVIDSEAPAGINNERIRTANTWVLSVAEQNGARYLNAWEALADENGSLRSDYSNGDGMHLDEDGCDAVLQYIRTHGCI